MSVKLTIHSTGTGTCSLTGKEGLDGLTVTFEDGTVKEGFLSWKAFQQLLRMKAGAKPAIPAAQPLTGSIGESRQASTAGDGKK